jgi:putative lipoprotein
MHIVLPTWRWLPLMIVAMISPATVAMAGELAGSEWRPNQIGAAAVSSEAELFVQFKGEGELSGHGGCNGFFGQYEITQNTIRVGPLGATMMACQGPVMDQEKAFLAALETARTFQRGDRSLILFDADGKERVRLTQTDWD